MTVNITAVQFVSVYPATSYKVAPEVHLSLPQISAQSQSARLITLLHAASPHPCIPVMSTYHSLCEDSFRWFLQAQRHRHRMVLAHVASTQTSYPGTWKEGAQPNAIRWQMRLSGWSLYERHMAHGTRKGVTVGQAQGTSPASATDLDH